MYLIIILGLRRGLREFTQSPFYPLVSAHDLVIIFPLFTYSIFFYQVCIFFLLHPHVIKRSMNAYNTWLYTLMIFLIMLIFQQLQTWNLINSPEINYLNILYFYFLLCIPCLLYFSYQTYQYIEINPE